MIGRKVEITYKRKRVPSRPGSGFENECPDQIHGFQTPEPDIRDPVKLNKHALNNGESSVLRNCEYCHCLYDVEGQFPSNEDNNLKKLCSSCVKHQDKSLTLQNVGNSCEDTMKVKRWGFPLVTFSRRSKRKKTVDGIPLQETSTSVEKCDLQSHHVLTSVRADFSSEKSSNEELTIGSCISKDTPLIAESSGKSLMDAKSYDKDNSLKVSQSLGFAADESRIISSDEIESAKATIDKKQDEGSLVSFDLSKPPPEISGLVDCNLTLDCSSNEEPYNNVSENHQKSTDSTSRSHSIEFPSRSRALDLRTGPVSLSQLHCAPPRHSSTWGPSVSIGQSQTLNNNLLQLFPEDRVNDILPPHNPLNRTPLHSTCSTPIQDTVGAQYPIDSVSLMRHKMMLDNILSKARPVKSVFERPNAWTEEELDFLWIGVRRHGLGSWDAILRDPRLHFTSWRSPRELAERWREEQSNLLRTKPTTKKENHILVQEPHLSLGVRGRSSVGPLLAPKGNSDLPHWLQGAVSFPPSVSYTGHSGLMQWINQPFGGPNRTMGPRLQPTSAATHLGGQPVATHPSSKPNEVIVIDSEASSEETISDGHCVSS